MNWPEGIAFDASGNLIIADTYNNRVRKVAPDGTFSTLAGQALAGYANGIGASTQFNLPTGIAIDKTSGDIYVSDYNNNRIRRIHADGTVDTVVGDGVGRYGGDNGPANTASIFHPQGLAFDSGGNLYIADQGNHRVRRVTNGVIATVAGSGTAGFLGDGMPAVNARLSSPAAVAFDNRGNLLIVDYGNNRLRRVTSDGNINTIAGNGTSSTTGDGGPASAATISQPLALAVDTAGNIFIAERGTNTVRRIATDGTIMTVAGKNGAGFSGDGGLALDAQLYMFPTPALAFDAAGKLYILDSGNSRVRVVTPAP
jgi:sugar lactone lactonase YvrE